jgi:hypothetical protein
MKPIYAVNSFSFIIKGEGRITGEQFAEKISEHYSTDNPETADAIRTIRRCVEWIEAYYHRLTIVRFVQAEYDKIAML